MIARSVSISKRGGLPGDFWGAGKESYLGHKSESFKETNKKYHHPGFVLQPSKMKISGAGVVLGSHFSVSTGLEGGHDHGQAVHWIHGSPWGHKESERTQRLHSSHKGRHAADPESRNQRGQLPRVPQGDQRRDRNQTRTYLFVKSVY